MKVKRKHPNGRPPVKLPVSEIARLYGEGYSTVELSRMFKTTPGVVTRRLRESGIELRSPAESYVMSTERRRGEPEGSRACPCCGGSGYIGGATPAT